MSIQRVTTQNFGGEVKFTKWLCDEGRECLGQLFEACFGDSDSFKDAKAEAYTSHGKRVDIVVKFKNQNITIECQDAAGSLDPLHACKAQYYAFDLDAIYNLIICEDSDEQMRSYIRYENEHPRKNNFLIEYQILTTNEDNFYIAWTPVVKPLELPQKKRQASKSMTETSKRKVYYNNNVKEVFSGEFPMEIEGVDRDGTIFKATLNEDKTVVMENGERYDSITQAANKLTNRVQNAWVFWKYKGEYFTTHQLRYEGLTKDDFSPDEWRHSFAPNALTENTEPDMLNIEFPDPEVKNG